MVTDPNAHPDRPRCGTLDEGAYLRGRVNGMRLVRGKVAKMRGDKATLAIIDGMIYEAEQLAGDDA